MPAARMRHGITTGTGSGQRACAPAPVTPARAPALCIAMRSARATTARPEPDGRALAATRAVRLTWSATTRRPGLGNPVSTICRPRASRSCADVARATGSRPIPWPLASTGRPPADVRVLPVTRARMPRSAQTMPEDAQQSMITKTWTSPPRRAWCPRRFVVIYRRGHQGRSGKARCSLSYRVHVAMGQAGRLPERAAAWR